MKPNFTCSYCSRPFTVKHKWVRHQLTHTKPFKCKFCGKAFAETSKATSHEQICYFGLKPMPTLEIGKTKEGFKVKISSKHLCVTCKKSFESAENLKTHRKTVHPKVTWKCGCGLKLEPTKLMKHRLSCRVGIKKKRAAKKDQRKATYTAKPKSRSKKSRKKAFISTPSDHKYAMEPIKKETRHKKGTRHKEPKHNKVTSRKESKLKKGTKRCSECSVVVQNSSFAYHQKFHGLSRLNKKYLFNYSTGKVFLCRYKTCCLAFESSAELVKHEEIHTGPKPYMCSACDYMCKTSVKLNTHFAECKDRYLLKYPCGYCGKFFSRTSILWRHYEMHRPDRKDTYSCGHCRSQFSTRLELNKHHSGSHQTHQPRTKTSGIIFNCNFCPKKFKTQEDLVHHVQHSHLSMIASTSKAEHTTASHADKKQVQHIKTKLYKCSYCGQGFSTASVKSRHERVHTNEKPHVCYNCGRAFTFKYVLKRHQQKECKAVDDKDAISPKSALGDCTKDDDDNVISISSESSESSSESESSSDSSESDSPSPPTQAPPIHSRATIPSGMQQLAPVAIFKYPDNSSNSQFISLGSATAPNLFTSISCLPSTCIPNQVYVFQDQPLGVMIPSQEMTGGLSLQPPRQDILPPAELPSEQLVTAERIRPAGDVQNVCDLDNAIPMKLQRLT